MKTTTNFITLALLAGCTISPKVIGTNLPQSRQAALVEAVSPAEVMVYASGIGLWRKGDSKWKDYENYLLRQAEIDARRTAVWFVLFGGSDPLLTREDEQASFQRLQEEFFDAGNVSKFISWEGDDFLKRTKREIVKKKEYQLTIEKAFKINVSLLRENLIERGILIKREELAEAIGLPFIMVIPTVNKGENPVAEMRAKPNLSHAAKVIESYLTARRYDVIVPEQQTALEDLASAQQMVKGLAEDYSYQLALSVGSDVYITFEVEIQADKFNTRKAVVSVRAFETTTARLLGAETGYSTAAPSPEGVLIEQAVGDAIDKVLSRVSEYWKEDAARGVQYKLVITIASGFDGDQVEELGFAFGDVLKSVAKGGKFKENIVSSKTLDYSLWCDPAQYRTSTELYRALKGRLAESFPMGTLQQVNMNRKLMLLKVTPI